MISPTGSQDREYSPSGGRQTPDSIFSDGSTSGRGLNMRVTGDTPKAYTRAEKDIKRLEWMKHKPVGIESGSEYSDNELGSVNSLNRSLSPGSQERSRKWSEEVKPVYKKKQPYEENSSQMVDSQSVEQGKPADQKSKGKMIGAYAKPYKTFGKIEAKTDLLEEAMLSSPVSPMSPMQTSISEDFETFGTEQEHTETKTTETVKTTTITQSRMVSKTSKKELRTSPARFLETDPENAQPIDSDENVNIDSANTSIAESSFKKNIKLAEPGPELYETETIEQPVSINASEEDLLKVAELQERKSLSSKLQKPKSVTVKERKMTEDGEIIETLTTTVVASKADKPQASSVYIVNTHDEAFEEKSSESEEDDIFEEYQKENINAYGEYDQEPGKRRLKPKSLKEGQVTKVEVVETEHPETYSEEFEMGKLEDKVQVTTTTKEITQESTHAKEAKQKSPFEEFTESPAKKVKKDKKVKKVKKKKKKELEPQESSKDAVSQNMEVEEELTHFSEEYILPLEEETPYMDDSGSDDDGLDEYQVDEGEEASQNEPENTKTKRKTKEPKKKGKIDRTENILSTIEAKTVITTDVFETNDDDDFNPDLEAELYNEESGAFKSKAPKKVSQEHSYESLQKETQNVSKSSQIDENKDTSQVPGDSDAFQPVKQVCETSFGPEDEEVAQINHAAAERKKKKKEKTKKIKKQEDLWAEQQKKAHEKKQEESKISERVHEQSEEGVQIKTEIITMQNDAQYVNESQYLAGDQSQPPIINEVSIQHSYVEEEKVHNKPPPQNAMPAAEITFSGGIQVIDETHKTKKSKKNKVIKDETVNEDTEKVTKKKKKKKVHESEEKVKKTAKKKKKRTAESVESTLETVTDPSQASNEPRAIEPMQEPSSVTETVTESKVVITTMIKTDEESERDDTSTTVAIDEPMHSVQIKTIRQKSSESTEGELNKSGASLDDQTGIHTTVMGSKVDRSDTIKKMDLINMERVQIKKRFEDEEDESEYSEEDEGEIEESVTSAPKGAEQPQQQTADDMAREEMMWKQYEIHRSLQQSQTSKGNFVK